LRLQEREAVSEQQRLGTAQQEKKGEEESGPYADNRKDKVKMRKATEEVSDLFLLL
jgi:DNA invertase Pin-like site-specific DNA recombinase